MQMLYNHFDSSFKIENTEVFFLFMGQSMDCLLIIMNLP